MIGGAGDDQEVDEASAEKDVKDETRIEEARETIRRPASRPTAENIRWHWAAHLLLRDSCPECTAGSANNWLTDAAMLRQNYLQPLSCIATAASPRTKLAETMTMSHLVSVNCAGGEWVALTWRTHGDSTSLKS